MKILFSHGYYYPLDAKQWKQGTPFPPLGTMYAASYARKKGHQVDLFDVGLKVNASEITQKLDEQPDVLVIYDDGFNYLTKMCLTTMRHATFEMIKKANSKKIGVIVCSSDSTDHYEEYIKQGASVVLMGEGEQSLIEVLEAICSRKHFSDIKGIAYMNQNEVRLNAKRPVLRNLDELPMPAWDLVDVNAYKAIWKKHGHHFQLNIATTRGCPYHCNWCAKPIYGQRYNVRSPKNVVEEINFIKQQYQVTNFWMCDDIFGLKPNWVQEFEKELKAHGCSITYKIQSRADLLLKENNIEALVNSGLKEAWIGAESGSQKILDAMDKGTTVEQIKKATELMQANGVKVGHFLQFGYLGETHKDIQATFDLLQQAKPDAIGVSVSYPLPGTPFYEKVKHELKSKANWTDSDDLALMFQNTFNKTYYRILHRLVHKKFKWNQLIRGLKTLDVNVLTPVNLAKLLIYPPIIFTYHLMLIIQKNTTT